MNVNRITNHFILILIIGALSLDAFAQAKKKLLPPVMLDYLKSKDKSREAIFKYDKNRDNGCGFDKNARPASLSQNELSKIRELINISVVKYNKTHKGKYQFIKEPSKYYKQIIAVINSKGEKEVWISCYCQVFKDQWKTHIMLMNDGGSCKLVFKINLTKSIVVSFTTGGWA
jgi:hypothetical protein